MSADESDAKRRRVANEPADDDSASSVDPLDAFMATLDAEADAGDGPRPERVGGEESSEEFMDKHAAAQVAVRPPVPSPPSLHCPRSQTRNLFQSSFVGCTSGSG